MPALLRQPSERAHAGVVSDVPDPEVPAKPTRRRFSAAYKLAIIAEYDGVTEPGAKGALLRREGLSSSHVVEWRRARDTGALTALERKRGRKPADERETKIARLRRRLERSEAELTKARKTIDVQGKTLRALGGALRERTADAQAEAGRMTEQALAELAAQVGTAAACKAVGRARATHYRHHRVCPAPGPAHGPPAPAKPQPRALTETERAQVRELLHSERFVDKAPARTYAELLDEDVYVCSIRTMYRILTADGETRERRRQATHPAKVKPELCACRPNEVWSWDITKLHGASKGCWYHLYVIIDIYSRYVPGWLLAEVESAELAEKLLGEAIAKQDVTRDRLTIHADRGTSMASKPVAALLADLGVAKSHSRPHCSNDNPYSEAQLKTLKYCPTFPERFGSIQDARTFARTFFTYYNTVHRHSGIGLLTPADVHYGRAAQVYAARQDTLDLAYATHPERFVRKPPAPPALPAPAWINQPKQSEPDTQ
ncbi:MAG: IS3 family transposase [Egibacteraceae bacterium]